MTFAFQKQIALRLRYLERVPLGTTYPEVGERVKRMTRSAELAGRGRLVVDATGVGRLVVDLLRDADLRCGIMPVMIISGEMETAADGYHRAPKRDVITGDAGAAAEGGAADRGGLPLREALFGRCGRCRCG